MLVTLQSIFENTLSRLSYQIITYLPGLLAGLTILLFAYLLARLGRWLILRIFRGMALDQFLQQSGLSVILDGSGQLRATRLVAETVYWGLLLLGFLTGLSAFNTELTSRIIETVVSLFPKVVTAAVILLAGLWLGQYLGRGALVWAFNEGLPSPRRLATAVRVIIPFIAVVVAADQLDFAKNVFLAAFIILVGGGVLALSLALGLQNRDWLHHYLHSQVPSVEGSMERSLQDHL
jgi:mechanosensitive ion channel-like protein